MWLALHGWITVVQGYSDAGRRRSGAVNCSRKDVKSEEIGYGDRVLNLT